ncbi:glycosyltransferase BC10 [Cornus florida]|uniref:glycosyltransferase BC10 n=1 Tax=Cornus florida TaxID=4283 RepID=UPI0028999CFD|nr:glycosyltransferase BC10 [Cornus florida]XP_059645239.1 glycosyltransferase BC10 [Cornus florida]XP_059645240.1 glycosyltransferase BC10 [Cornus florida]XP_059645241.1 glycosyltransferase BC10 [Cornus florida]
MKTVRAWRLGIRDMLSTSGYRQRPHLKRPIWVIILVCLVSIFLLGAYIYPPRSSAACYIFSSSSCTMYEKILPIPSRELSDEETAAQVVIREILKTPFQSKNPKIAFLFLTPGPLPFEMLWDKFFQGHEDRFTIYVHASREKPVHLSRYFAGREIRSEQVVWGTFSMVDAERRLLANALKDPDNQQFVLLSDSCVPLHNFDYVYNYLIFTNVSFIDCFVDPGPHGGGRYSPHMMPEVEYKDFRKGSQWFTMKRQHAIILMADSLYYTKFKLFCRPNMDGRNCYADEHYLPTFFHMIDPGGMANWSVTYVDWSEGKWHPRSYRAQDVTYELLKMITSTDDNLHVTSDQKKTAMINPCTWNGMQRPCYLFARKFYPETLDNLMHIFSNYTIF